MIIEALTLGELQTNCYLVYDPDSLEGIVIDPADEAVFIAEKIQRLHINLKAIIATHGHFDHNLAAGELQLIYPNTPYYIDEKDLFLLKNMNSSASHWLKRPSKRPLPQDIHFLNEGDFRLSTLDFRLIHTPGHTPGGICIYTKYQIQNTKYDALFSGDTLFKGAVGRTDLSYSDPKALHQSLKMLFKLSADTLVYPGHGEMTTIGEENIKFKIQK